MPGRSEPIEIMASCRLFGALARCTRANANFVLKRTGDYVSASVAEDDASSRNLTWCRAILGDVHAEAVGPVSAGDRKGGREG